MIDLAFEDYKPKIADRYSDMIRHQFEQMVKKFGPKLKGIYNANEGKAYRETVSAVIKQNHGSFRLDEIPDKEIDDNRLAKMASEYAAATVDMWRAKIEGKIGDLNNAEIKHLDGYRFLISGFRDGKKVQIEQDMIINVSNRGKLFNQFPARIYVDGKFTPESKYKGATQ